MGIHEREILAILRKWTIPGDTGGMTTSCVQGYMNSTCSVREAQRILEGLKRKGLASGYPFDFENDLPVGLIQAHKYETNPRTNLWRVTSEGKARHDGEEAMQNA